MAENAKWLILCDFWVLEKSKNNALFAFFPPLSLLFEQKVIVFSGFWMVLRRAVVLAKRYLLVEYY